MRLCSFRRPDDTIAHGELSGGQVTEWGAGDLSAVVRDASAARAGISGATWSLEEIQLLAPLLTPPKVLCAATNYQEHIVEGGGTRVDKRRTSPKIFLKPATAIAGPGQPFTLPEISAGADWEAELAVVIGRGGSCIPVEEALEHVFGYAVSNDISLRQLAIGHERDTDNPWVGFFDWLEGKWADGSAPIGPWLVTADEVADPQALEISLTVNGRQRQHSSTSAMIFTCAELIAFCSRLCTLVPGDIILTGTPAGVGATTGEFLTDGDEMVADIAGLGSLVTPVVGPGS